MYLKIIHFNDAHDLLEKKVTYLFTKHYTLRMNL